MKKIFALILSASLLLSGCAASERDAASGMGQSAALSDIASDSAAASDNGGASADTEEAPPATAPEVPAESKTESAVSSEDGGVSAEPPKPETESAKPSESLPESVPESEAPAESAPESTRGTESTKATAVTASDSTPSVPPKSECKPAASTKKPAESTAATPAELPDTAPPEPTEEAPAEKPAQSAGFYVSGTKLYDANGNEFVMRGINHPHSWFKDKDETALAAIAKTGANCVRIVCSDGQQYQKDSADALTELVERCKALEMIAILEVHDITGRDDLSALERTVDFWIEAKDALIGSEAYVILNIANEWVGTWETDTWTKGYTAALPRLREAGIRNTVMVDAAGWGQYAKSVSDGGEKVFEADPLGNTMFSIHMYGSAGKNDRMIKQNLERVTEKGLCVVVGEFGHTHSDGDVDEAFIMKYCGENDIGYLGWSWKGNGGGVEYLDIALEWDGSSLSEDWGKSLIEGETGIRATSEKCSVFK